MNRRNRSAGMDAGTPQDVVIAVFDVLGFRERVAATPLAELGESYRELLRLKRHAARVPVLSLAGVDEWSSPSAVFSDTILFWAAAEGQAVDSFLTTCSVLIADALDRGWPLRGAIAAGACILDRKSRVFIGQPIVDAHLLEQAQDWLGAAIHPSCFTHPPVGALFGQSDNIVSYTPPLKPGYRVSVDHVIEWSSRTVNWDASLTALELAATGSAAEKYKATRSFIHATRGPALGAV